MTNEEELEKWWAENKFNIACGWTDAKNIFLAGIAAGEQREREACKEIMLQLAEDYEGGKCELYDLMESMFSKRSKQCPRPCP